MKTKFILFTLFLSIGTTSILDAATVYCRCKNTGERNHNTNQKIALSGDPRPVCDQFCADKGGRITAEKK